MVKPPQPYVHGYVGGNGVRGEAPEPQGEGSRGGVAADGLDLAAPVYVKKLRRLNGECGHLASHC